MNATSAVRSMNEKTVAQTRATPRMLSTLERTFDAAGQGVVAFNRKFVNIAQRNVNAAFDLAKSMAEPRRDSAIARGILAEAMRQPHVSS